MVVMSAKKRKKRRSCKNRAPITELNGVLLLSAIGLAQVLSVSRALVWKLHSAGRLPEPVYLSTKAPRWVISEIRRWVAAGCPNRQTWKDLQALECGNNSYSRK
jgi:predicted DNA-binding transcriptional regulator AlpA